MLSIDTGQFQGNSRQYIFWTISTRNEQRNTVQSLRIENFVVQNLQEHYTFVVVVFFFNKTNILNSTKLHQTTLKIQKNNRSCIGLFHPNS